jgi:hypothetical protein
VLAIQDSIMMTQSFVGVDVDNQQLLSYFKPAHLFNEILSHLVMVDDSFLVYELQKHRARWKGVVLIFD